MARDNGPAVAVMLSVCTVGPGRIEGPPDPPQPVIPRMAKVEAAIAITRDMRNAGRPRLRRAIPASRIPGRVKAAIEVAVDAADGVAVMVAVAAPVDTSTDGAPTVQVTPAGALQ